ncbi:MAG: PAS domain S-box protein [Chloroflexi bacterium]|nr:PAS domain S-box protein [Chloroflexota bacterium]
MKSISHGQSSVPEEDSSQHLLRAFREDDDAPLRPRAGPVQRRAEVQAHSPGEREARLRALVENLLDLIFVVDAQGVLADVVGDSMGIAGYMREELLAYDLPGFCQALFSPEDVPLVLEAIQRTQGALNGTRLRVRLQDRAGETRWCELACLPLRDEGDHVLGVQGILRDISEYVRTEMIIHALNKAAEAVQHASLSVESVLDAVTAELTGLGFYAAIVLLNGERVQTFRLSGDAVTVQALLRFIAQEKGMGLLTLADFLPFEQVIEERRPVLFAVNEASLERVIRRVELARGLGPLLPPLQAAVMPLLADESIIGLLWVGHKALNSALLPALEVLANQTAIAIRNAQLLSRLSESEEQYRGIFEATRDGLLVLSETGNIVEANPAAWALFAYERPTLCERHIEDVLDLLSFGGIQGFIAAAQQSPIFQLEGVRRGGQRFPAEVRIAPLNFRGQAHFLAVVTDVTERVKAQEALLQTERLRALGQMAGGIAHDFNNILVGIRGFADMALMDLDENPAFVRADLEHILKGTKDAADAVRRLQSLYREPADTSDFVPVQLNTLVEDALALTRPRWKDQPQSMGYTVYVETHLGEPALVHGNPSELRRVISNLILNAVDAMPEGGTLTIQTGREGDWNWVRVTDTGTGIPPEVAARLFTPFFTTKGGTGLGLTVSKAIVQRHGGEISFESAPGRGTTFCVRLPVAGDVGNPSSAGSKNRPEKRLRQGCRVLVVDDEPVVRELLKRLLERLGQVVTLVSSGREALTLLQEGSFDLLVTDLGMPDISGRQVAHEARTLHPDLPIILTTGWGETITPEKLAEIRATALLPKPFTHHELVAVLEKALGPVA